MRHALLPAFLIAFASLISLPGYGEDIPISDMGRALEFCESHALESVEGIWEFPADNTTVLIRRDRSRHNRVYELIVVASPDCRIRPGDKIGEMTPSADPVKFHLSLFRSKKDGVLTDPGTCAATFNTKKGAIFIEKRKLKLRLPSRILSILPQFWRIVSMFKVDDPAASLPEGLVRVFPAAPSAGPRYL